MNNDMIKGKWLELKGELTTMWGKLTHDELDRTEGNVAAIAGLIQEKYGETKEAIGDKLKALFGDTKDQAENMTDKAATFVADKTEQAKDALNNANQEANTSTNTMPGSDIQH